MRTLAFDGRMGASGDMILGALLAAGADPAVLEPVENELDYRYHIDTTRKNGITATTMAVVRDIDDTSNECSSHTDCSHDHEGQHHGDHDHTHDERDGSSRRYAEVVELVESMDLSKGIETDAKAIFEVLGQAEAEIHGIDLDEIHFHEVGADDAIADIVGAVLLFNSLDPDRVVTTALATGGGAVEISHGVYPVPVPAVIEIAEHSDWAFQGGPVDAELLTPTGAAILAHFAEGVERLPTLNLSESGYGAGDHDFPAHPNVLRVLIGESKDGLACDEIRVLETTLDDASPEVLGGLHDSLAAAGARDVSVIPTTMKKSRPGHLVQVVVKPENTTQVIRQLATETGTLGVRETGVRSRWIAERKLETAEIEIEESIYEVAVKIASDTEGEIYDISAEYDDASAVATETDLPIREIMRRAENAVQ